MATAARTPASTDAGLVWSRHWETELGETEHDAIALLLAAAFPRTGAFGQGRSWVGARPERRLVARRDGRPVAHAALVRRFLRAPDEGRSVLVGDVGLVAVDPARQGTGLGAALLAEVAATLADLDLPFGFLTCGPEVAAFYRRGGWQPADQPLHAIDVHHHVETDRANGMLLPVRQARADWPRGRLVRDGEEL
ncbi:GNAT family N-acetyltransferase [Actinomycetospora chiangmaiensis]|uniref:GNAT family N-acetyltransferase n=1 Tax=Actinomycetospora chiangmaiensis TaxID=402650 RepID=UPI000379B78C|nr:GNAT family N-acetyltransferase [Actinomycetospora chiangmaiensis]